ncbi:MAG: hypothetical protein KZQ63_19230 [Candidatus Thiodiazotropha sp. (ex Lucinoma aequizonata)]|nr:hypothetical protein [Candidatus Thiodiazotropha sp. (ex Lucinoma aequizonata)]
MTLRRLGCALCMPFHLSLSVAIPAIQPRLRLSGSNRLRSTFHGGQRTYRNIKPTVRKVTKS